MDIRDAFPENVTPVKFGDLNRGDVVVHFADGQAWAAPLIEFGDNTGEWWTNERSHYVFDKAAGEWGPAAVSYSREADILAVAPWHGTESGHSLFKVV